MKLGYSEFSFGYAFTENLIRRSAQAPTSAPQFPNLIEEGQLGYDVRIELPALPLFFQFKLPEWMVRRSAKEVALTRGALRPQFFRMPLMRRDLSDQHQLLLDLESRHPGSVFYASPRLRNSREFNAAYNSAEVHRRSALISPSAIGALPDDKPHVVSYRPRDTQGWFCSDPQEIPLNDFDAVAKKLIAKLHMKETPRLVDLAPHLAPELKAVRRRALEGEELGAVELEVEGTPQPIIEIDEGAIRERFRLRRQATVEIAPGEEEARVSEELYVAREIARIGLGVQLVIAQPKD
ncbi:hypothetical protein GRI89_00080 [Altererythrobacter salegens]|uniref:Uncharacterized protein n=1 Tax=Croceibacterium salegens TaxID=1737568 RepID=A0A6I4SQ64_9SPHN|nr:hypothetical protein [Croceibacterium salegens]MXO57945.1 hypothetical protein [Croceibacterium salegens]